MEKTIQGFTSEIRRNYGTNIRTVLDGTKGLDCGAVIDDRDALRVLIRKDLDYVLHTTVAKIDRDGCVDIGHASDGFHSIYIPEHDSIHEVTLSADIMIPKDRSLIKEGETYKELINRLSRDGVDLFRSPTDLFRSPTEKVRVELQTNVSPSSEITFFDNRSYILTFDKPTISFSLQFDGAPSDTYVNIRRILLNDRLRTTIVSESNETKTEIPRWFNEFETQVVRPHLGSSLTLGRNGGPTDTSTYDPQTPYHVYMPSHAANWAMNPVAPIVNRFLKVSPSERVQLLNHCRDRWLEYQFSWKVETKLGADYYWRFESKLKN